MSANRSLLCPCRTMNCQGSVRWWFGLHTAASSARSINSRGTSSVLYRGTLRRDMIVSIMVVCFVSISTVQRFVRGWKFLAAAALIVLAAGTTAAQVAPRVRLQLVASGLNQPVYVTHAGDGSGRLFIVEQGGRIRIWVNGAVRTGAFLDIRDRVTAGGEMGLLS